MATFFGFALDEKKREAREIFLTFIHSISTVVVYMFGISDVSFFFLF